MAGGVAYTVIWSVLLYFGWTDSPTIILWCDVITGIILLHLAYDIYHRGDRFTETRLLVRLIRLISLLYASAWTVIIMFTFGSELLLPFDLISLYITLSLSYALWKSLLSKRSPSI
ncbi:MAG: hypothetical protein AXA67_13375 [Methylothermaceae bacteria B42]|nr:MAG: hypothetical protein AXA67_13375 [Methylothermaceae bacteria B42]